MAFKKFDPEDLVISAETIVTPTWSNQILELDEFYIDNEQTGSNIGDFYYNIYNEDPNDENSQNPEIQFSVAYAHKKGFGALLFNPLVPERTATSVIYKQYESLILGSPDKNFVFGNYISDSFYVINIERARYKEKLLPGSLELNLNTISNNVTLIDDSPYNPPKITSAGRQYEIISGTLEDGVNTNLSPQGYAGANGVAGAYGLFYPDIGVILLNTLAMGITVSGGVGIQTINASDTQALNHKKLFEALSSFRLQSEETISSNYIFVRARNGDFNYSSNPTFIVGSSGDLLHEQLVNNPKTFATTVGLYNDRNELVAVAKLSRPLQKDFTKEILLRVKLDF
jgi:hypothetical protein